MLSVLIADAQRFDERLYDRLASIELARLIAAARRMFDELKPNSPHDDDLRRWLNEPGSGDGDRRD